MIVFLRIMVMLSVAGITAGMLVTGLTGRPEGFIFGYAASGIFATVGLVVAQNAK